MHVNKVHSVKTIDRIAKELGESVDWLHEVADEMDTEDGVIWVYGDTDDGVMAFTDFGSETLSDRKRKPRPTCRGFGVVGDIACRDHAVGRFENGRWLIRGA